MTQAGERTLMEWPADQTLIIRVPHQLIAAFGRMMPVHLTTRGVTLTVGDLRTKAASALGVSVSELALNIGSAFLSADDTTIESLKSELDRGVKIDARLTGDGAAARSPRDSTRRSKSKTRAAAGGLELPTLGHSPTASSVNTTQSAPPNIEQSARYLLPRVLPRVKPAPSMHDSDTSRGFKIAHTLRAEGPASGSCVNFMGVHPPTHESLSPRGSPPKSRADEASSNHTGRVAEGRGGSRVTRSLPRLAEQEVNKEVSAHRQLLALSSSPPLFFSSSPLAFPRLFPTTSRFPQRVAPPSSPGCPRPIWKGARQPHEDLSSLSIP